MAFTCRKCHDRIYNPDADDCLGFCMPSQGPCETCHQVALCSDCHGHPGSERRKPLVQENVDETVEKLKKIAEDLSG